METPSRTISWTLCEHTRTVVAVAPSLSVGSVTVAQIGRWSDRDSVSALLAKAASAPTLASARAAAAADPSSTSRSAMRRARTSAARQALSSEDRLTCASRYPLSRASSEAGFVSFGGSAPTWAVKASK